MLTKSFTPFLSPRELAEAFGVSESSLKRWIDAGRIRASRTEGGHRRIAVADAIAFARKTRTPIAQPALLGLTDRAPLDERTGDDTELYHALVRGDAAAVRDWFERCAADVAAGSSIAAQCDGPIREAMHAIGELWKHDADGVFVEHRATDLCIQGLGQLRTALAPPPTTRVALGGAPEDDPYAIPTAMAALVLAAEGIQAINLGPDSPTSALHRAVVHHQPALVWISATSPLPLAQAHELAAFLGSLPGGALAVVGGRHGASIAAADRSILTAASMADLVAIARR